MSGASDKLSGYQFKKKREEREEKEQFLLKKIPKISSFFSGSRNDDPSEECSTSTDKPEIVKATASKNETGAVAESKFENIIDNSGNEKKNHATDFTFSQDPALWKINEQLRDHVALNGVSQNSEADFSTSQRRYPDKVRFISKNLFSRKLLNGEIRNRSWLVYSISKGCVYCVPCMLFGDSDNYFTTGFNDWKNSNQRVQDHESSSAHNNNLVKLKMRGISKGRVDGKLLEQLEEESNYWRSILKRVVAGVKFLALKGLAFRGSIEHIGQDSEGNFLGLLKFLSEFDPFLAKHICRYGNVGSGHASYLSKTTCEEFISLMSQKVMDEIMTEAKDSKYFGIVVDSTPDISHTDQLTFILRYVSKFGEPVERFLCFLPNVSHKSANIVEAILHIFTKHKLDGSNCRGQSYDNASNMSGIYSGTQTRIKAHFPYAEFVPCSAHSLNLVGSCAAESCVEAVSFFGLLQELYNFFSCSTYRWSHLSENCRLVLQNLSKTRWSARHDACRVLQEDWAGIMKTLNEMANDVNEKAATRHDARALKEKLMSLETCFMTIIWGQILDTFNKVNKKLQSPNTDLGQVKLHYSSLSEFISNLRNEFDHLENLAKEKSEVTEYRFDNQRQRKRKLFHGESREGEVSLTGRENFRNNTVYVILDSLSTALAERAAKYDTLYSKFGFLENLPNLDGEQIYEKSNQLKSLYPNDLEDSLSNECMHLKSLLAQHPTTRGRKKLSMLEMSRFIHENDVLEMFANVEISLRMILSAPATNCSGERSFSTLRRVKNYLRSTMEEERLSALALLTIEKQITERISYDNIIDDFAQKKARKVILSR